VKAIRARLPPGTAIELWWQDEARVGQKNTLPRRWARRGSRPTAPKDQRTAYASSFGAICPEKGKGAGLVLPRCDSEAMSLHLAEISRSVSPGAHAVLMLDGAGWHGAPDLVGPDNITLLTLPPCAPELNPVENVWQFIRDNWLGDRIFTSYDDIVDRCCEAWNRLVDQPWKIMSLGLLPRPARLGPSVMINADYGLFGLERVPFAGVLLLLTGRSDAGRRGVGKAGASDRGVSAEGQDPAAGSAPHALGHPLAASERSQVARHPV
jgi:hypothetical protein